MVSESDLSPETADLASNKSCFNNQDEGENLNSNAELDSIARIKKRRLDLLDRANKIAAEVKPMEFESYRDYFILKTFKRGKSDSGKLDVSNLKRFKISVYYERISKSNEEKRTGSTPSSLPESSAEDNDYKPTMTRITRKQSQDVSNSNSSTPVTFDDKKGADGNSLNSIRADISVDSIIPKDNSAANVRRSMRLTTKEKEKLKKSPSEKLLKEGEEPMFTDLYEVIIPKIPNPVRRSDWVLNKRERYIREKHVPVKHIPEQVKINELVKNSRIKTVLSRFEGGLAGVRTSKNSP
ncbi:HBL337Wp [Eremothecium sinecaudum]|uniref:HBL337Wp n=1 Tax=Eremothecium sinecaudum TaxID=45286 RepID=A0A125RDT8_9SACH|nr:HBL337Wp [Eremothecium sinecaudum]AMD18565.1 HBL337Wp [Eremothecium sinecaudum]